MRRAAVGTCISTIVAVALVVAAPNAGALGNTRVTYCHRSDSVENPYVEHSTDADSIIKEGHGDHTGPVFPAEGPDGKWGDIIPPFAYSGGIFPGLNWLAGHNILEGGCAVHETERLPEETTTTTTTTTTTISSTTAETTTTTAESTSLPDTATPTTGAPSEPTVTAGGSTAPTAPGESSSSVPATTAAGVTTTVAASATTLIPPTTAPESEFPLRVRVLVFRPSGPLPRVAAVVIIPSHRLVVIGFLSPSQTIRLKAELDHPIASTGGNEHELTGIGIIAVAVGIAAVWLARKRDRDVV